MKALEVIDHYYDIRAAESVQLERYADVHEGFEWLRNVDTSEECPRPSLQLIRHLCSMKDITRTHNDKFLEEFAVPLSGVDIEDDPIELPFTEQIRREGICFMAEGFWVNAARQVSTGRDYDQPSITVYHDDNLRPLLLRKTHESSSALTLWPARFGRYATSATLPAGIIGTIYGGILTGEWAGRHTALRTYLIDRTSAFNPRRPTPWSYSEPLDRAIFGVRVDTGRRQYQVTVSEARLDASVNYTIEDFRAAAAKIMDRCGLGVA